MTGRAQGDEGDLWTSRMCKDTFIIYFLVEFNKVILLELRMIHDRRTVWP